MAYIGLISLWIALALTFVELFSPLSLQFPLKFKTLYYWNSLGQTFFLLVAILILLIGLLSDNLSFVYVFKYSSAQLPILYKIGALWGSNAGALLLWVFILSLWKSSLLKFKNILPAQTITKALFIIALVSFVFIFYILYFSNPLLTMEASKGMGRLGLNPLLQDFGLGIHPPLLYTGILGFAVPFALGGALLLEGSWNNTVAKVIRFYSLLSFILLSLGIIIGGWWSYRVLGWGGWWGWDPVENLSLFPWLVGLSLLHSLYISYKYEAFKLWSLFLALLSFSMSLFTTVLIRSGFLISSHAFVKSASFSNLFLMIFLFLIIGAVFILFAIRAWKIKSHSFKTFPKQLNFMLFSSAIVFLFMLTIALGTFYPIMIDVLGYGKISVGAPYFNFMIMIFIIPCLLLLTILMEEKFLDHRDHKIFYYSILFLISGGLSLGMTLAFYETLASGAWGFMINIFAISLFLSSLQVGYKIIFTLKSFKPLGSTIAHMGVALLVFGVINNSTGIMKNLRMKVGDSVIIQNKNLVLKNLSWEKSQNYLALVAVFSFNNHLIKPSIRYYNLQKYVKSVPAIKSELLGDLYLSLGRPVSSTLWTVQVLTKPFINVIWLGSFIIILGTFFAFLNLLLRKKNNSKMLR